MMKLKLDNSITRENDRGTRTDPIKPLTPEQEADLIKTEWKACRIAYVNRFMKSKLLADYEGPKDLEADAWIFFKNILGKFDVSKYEGKISKKYDVQGAGKPKTLGFYFKNYFYQRINFTACEARTDKKLRGTGPAEHMDEIAYDPEDTATSLSEHNHKYDVTGEIFAEVKKKDTEFQRFFYQLCIEQCTHKELREEYKDKFKIYKSLLEDMAKKFSDKYKLNSSTKKLSISED